MTLITWIDTEAGVLVAADRAECSVSNKETIRANDVRKLFVSKSLIYAFAGVRSIRAAEEPIKISVDTTEVLCEYFGSLCGKEPNVSSVLELLRERLRPELDEATLRQLRYSSDTTDDGAQVIVNLAIFQLLPIGYKADSRALCYHNKEFKIPLFTPTPSSPVHRIGKDSILRKLENKREHSLDELLESDSILRKVFRTAEPRLSIDEAVHLFDKIFALSAVEHPDHVGDQPDMVLMSVKQGIRWLRQVQLSC